MQLNCYPNDIAKEILNNMHEGHQGITKCRARTPSVWWPGVSKDVKSFLNRCNVCVKYCINLSEPLLQSTLPYHFGQKCQVIILFHNECVYLWVDF